MKGMCIFPFGWAKGTSPHPSSFTEWMKDPTVLHFFPSSLTGTMTDFIAFRNNYMLKTLTRRIRDMNNNLTDQIKYILI